MKITNEDNMQLMARYEDNHFDLAIVDPPYGIGFSDYQRSGDKLKERYTKNGKKKWDDNPPQKEYFDELFRVSKNQIIWGGNYFDLPPTQCFVFWDKMATVTNFADGELAWTSFAKVARKFKYAWNGLSDGIVGRNKKIKSIHPTQKPIQLYEWLLDNYAKEGDKILDTHLGSGSIAIACHNRKFDLTACELDTEYYTKAMERIEQHKKQLTLF